MKRIFALFLLGIMLTLAAAAETVLPDENVFSPGMAAVTQALSDGGTLETDCSAEISKLFYITDVRVLQAVFSGLSVNAVSGPSGSGEATQMTLSRNGEKITEALLYSDAGGSLLQLNGKLMDTGAWMPRLSFFPEPVQNGLNSGAWNRFERLPLEALESMLQQAEPGKSFFGFTVKTPILTERTMSDDGERFTRLNFSGTLTNGADWTLTGELFRPGVGKSPRDTAEITLECDKDNNLTFAMSALHQYSTVKKNVSGTVTVKTRMHLEGKLAGNAVNTTLTITQKNTWKLTETGLDETISVTMGFDWLDKDPALTSLNLNNVSIDTRETIRLDPSDPLAWTDDADVTAVTAGETVFSGKLHMASRITDKRAASLQGPAEPVTLSALSEVLKAEGESAAKTIYGQLDETVRGLIEKGL